MCSGRPQGGGRSASGAARGGCRCDRRPAPGNLVCADALLVLCMRSGLARFEALQLPAGGLCGCGSALPHIPLARSRAAAAQGDIAQLRAVYDGFLAEYPLCYGYWKKYADAEQRHSSPEAAAAVFERGVAAISSSVDLWGHYAACRQTAGASADEVRGCARRAGLLRAVRFALDRPPHLEPAFALVKRHALCSARTPAPSLPHCAGEHVSHFLSAANSSAACFPGVPRVARPQVPWALTRAGAPAAHGSLCSTASPALARRAHGKAPSLPASPESELPAHPGPTSLSAAARAAGSLSAAWRCAAPTSWRTRCGTRR